MQKFKNSEIYGISNEDYVKGLNVTVSQGVTVLDTLISQISSDISLLEERHNQVREYYRNGGRLAFLPILNGVPPSINTIESLLSVIEATKKRKKTKLSHYKSLQVK